MRAIVFAAGLGTRLKPFTLSHPKALVPVGGVPMLQRVISKLRAVGVEYIVVNVHHFAQQIIEFLTVNDNFGIDIRISDESDCLHDTGGGLLKAAPLFPGDEPIIVHNADVLTDFDIQGLVDVHTANDALATLLVAKRQTDRQLLMDDRMRMQGWIKLSTGEVRPEGLESEGLQPWAFGGVHVVSPQIFDCLRKYETPTPVFSITPFYIAQCAASPIYGYAPRELYTWYDIGKPESLANAEQSLI